MNSEDNKKPRVVSARESAIETWNSSLEGYKYSLFLSSAWILSMSNDKCKPLFLDFYSGDTIVGKVSGVISHGGVIKGRQFYCYASPALMADDKILYDACHAALLRFAVGKGIDRVIIGSYDQQHSMACSAKGFFTTSRFEFIVDCNGEAEARFSKGFNKNVKKAIKSGAVFNIDKSGDNLPDLWKLIESTRTHRKKKYETDYNPFYLKHMDVNSITRLVKTGAGQVYSTKSDQGCINNVLLNFEEGGRAYSLLMGSDDFAYQNGFSAFVDHSLIIYYKENHISYFNTGGGTNDSFSDNLQKYKEMMGGRKMLMYGATTNFLRFPRVLLNPLMQLGRAFPSKGLVTRLLRRIVN